VLLTCLVAEGPQRVERPDCIDGHGRDLLALIDVQPANVVCRDPCSNAVSRESRLRSIRANHGGVGNAL